MVSDVSVRPRIPSDATDASADAGFWHLSDVVVVEPRCFEVAKVL